jgi:GNAT superfamily N-acetyltransferase
MARQRRFEFRQISGSFCDYATIWQAELWVEGPRGIPCFANRYPAALAWVSETDMRGPTLEMVLVMDGYRRHGLGKAIVRACQEHWPGLAFTDPISEEGSALMNSLERPAPER